MRVKKPEKQQLINIEKEYVGFVIPIYPNTKPNKEYSNLIQTELINEYSGAYRFTYNWGLKEEENRGEDEKFITVFDLKKLFVQKRKEKGFEWLNYYDSSSLKLALDDLNNAYQKYFNPNMSNEEPKTKKKRELQQSFAIRKEKMTISEKGLEIPGFRSNKNTGSNKDLKNAGPIDIKFNELPTELQNLIRGSSNRISLPYRNYINPRIYYDGINYYLAFSLEKEVINYEEKNEEGKIIDIKPIQVCSNSEKNHKYNPEWLKKPKSEPIGIDIGCKRNKWMVAKNASQVIRITRPDQSKNDQKIANINRAIKHKKEVNKKKGRKKTNSYTKNQLKLFKKRIKYYQSITNRNTNELYNFIKQLLELKPAYVVLESISVKNIYESNKKQSSCSREKRSKNKQTQDAMLYTSGQMIERVLTNNNILVIRADMNYPSSQICPKCHHLHKIGKADTYVCPICGYIIDRDENAADNLANYEEDWEIVDLDDEKYIIYPSKKIPLVSFA